jgi:hypothetical protein
VKLQLLFGGFPTGAIRDKGAISKDQLMKLACFGLGNGGSTKCGSEEDERDREYASMAHVVIAC